MLPAYTHAARIERGEREGDRGTRWEFYEKEEFIRSLIEFNNPKSYVNQIGYHMCRNVDWLCTASKIHSHSEMP